ncbi:MAG TPA: beta-propeller fold lactonase family protein [Acidobacteriaceae bacterium]|nr:beta-propeller fold lactonase family protein [Acidobacteriaceae bacterium]
MIGRRLWGRWLVGFLCGSTLLLAGCADFFSKNGGGGGGGGGSVGSYTYVGTQTGTLVGYSVSSTGALATLSGSPNQFATASINALAVTPSNAFLYAGVAGIGLYGLTINSGTGVTSLINTSALVQDIAPLAMTVDPSGKFLLVAGLASGVAAVGEYAINSDGTLSEVQGSPVSITFPSGTDTTNLAVTRIAVAPNSSYVFVTLGQLGVAPLPFNTSGGLSPNTQIIKPLTSSGIANQDLGVAVNAGSTALFVGETNAGVRVFTIGSTFTEISGSPFKAGSQPRSLAFDGTGDYLYSANGSDATISGYSVLASGSLTALTGSPFSSVGSGPTALALDQSKKFLLSANLGGSPDVQLFSFDATTAGKLDPGATATNATSAVCIASTH